MKMTEEFVVIRNKKTGLFLTEYKDRGTLALEANFFEPIRKALSVPVEAYDDQKHDFKLLAKMLDGEIVKVKANYELTYSNGNDVQEIKVKKDDFRSMMEQMLKDVLGGEE